MKELIKKIIQFRDDRNWSQFHTPENLAKSIVIEASELLENYQWESGKADIENVKDELADILIYCLLLCEKYDFDFKNLIERKLKKNGIKYPIDKSFGKAEKYNKF